MQQFYSSLSVFWQLCIRDFYLAKSNYPKRIINTLVWNSIVLFVFTYIMPQTGLRIGSLIVVSNTAAIGLFDTTENLGTMLSDLEGERAITYYLTLPIPQWIVFAQIAIKNALRGLSNALLIMPISCLMFWGQFSFPDFCIFKFICMLVLSNLFYGFFSLVTASYTKNIMSMGNLWIRVIFPLWYLGCYQFTWQQMYSWHPYVAYLNLCNPLTLIFEGFRASSIDTAGSLPLWICLIGITCWTLLVGYIGITKFMKRLDCIR